MRTPIQWLAAVQRRILRQDNIVIFRLSGPIPQPPDLGPLELVRMGNQHQVDSDLVATAMQQAGETDVDTAGRFAQGHEFFALQQDNRIIAFRWVNFGDDRAGHMRLHAAPDRAYLYNAFTLPECRGRRLTHALMLHTGALLAEDGYTELVAGASSGNTSSLRAKRQGGLQQICTVRAWIVLHKFRVARSTVFHDPAGRALFRPSGGVAASASSPPSAPAR